MNQYETTEPARIDVEKRYLANWHYNAALILEELEKIIINNGGRLCSQWQSGPGRKKFEITNRSIMEKRHELEKTAERLERLHLTEAAKANAAELEKLANLNNDPVITSYADYLYVSFVYADYHYYFQMDRNPFFPFLYYKTKMLTENTTRRNVYGAEPSKEWLWDCFFSFDCSNADRREAANLIFNELVTARVSETYYTRERKDEQTLYFYEEV